VDLIQSIHQKVIEEKKMKKLAFNSVLLVSLVLVACSPASAPSEAKAPAVAVVPAASEAAPAPVQPAPAQPQTSSAGEKEVSFSNDIMPIFKQFAGDNHGPSASYSLASYEGVMKMWCLATRREAFFTKG